MIKARMLKDIFQNWYLTQKTQFLYLPDSVKLIDENDRVELWLCGDSATNLLFELERKCGHFRINLVATYRSIFWDIVAEYDIFEARTENEQYYCSECKPKYQKFYSSRTELVENHSLNPLLDWMNEYYIPSNYLVFYGSVETWTEAGIVHKSRLPNKMRDKEYVYSIRLIG